MVQPDSIPAPKPPAPEGDEQPRPDRQWPPRWPAWFAPAAFVAAFAVSIFVFVVIGAFVSALGGNVNGDDPTLTVIGTVLQDVVLVVTAVFFAWRVARPRLADFGLRPAPFWRALWITLGGLATYYFLVAVYSVAFHPNGKQTVTQDLGANNGTVAMIVAGIMVIVIAPVAEEVFFRGFFYGALRSRFSWVAAALIDGVVFGVIHYTGSGTLSILPVLALLGFVFCVVYELTGSLFTVIALHALNNAIAYGASTSGAEGLSVGLGLAMIAACVAVPALLARRQRPRVAP